MIAQFNANVLALLKTSEIHKRLKHQFYLDSQGKNVFFITHYYKYTYVELLDEKIEWNQIGIHHPVNIIFYKKMICK